MADIYNLISDQDLQAFADGELSGDRLHALKQAIDAQPDLRRRVEQLIDDAVTIRALRDKIYQDRELAHEIAALLVSKAPRKRSATSY